MGKLRHRRVTTRAIGLVVVLCALAACGGGNAPVDGGGLADGGREDGGASSLDGGVKDGGDQGVDGGDAGVLGADGGVCANDGQCALAHRCVFGACRPHAGGTGTPCPTGDECAVDALCTGSMFPNTGPICIRACAGGSCPGGYKCQFWQRERDGGTAYVSVCLPRNAFGTPCTNGSDPALDCTVAGQYCGGRTQEVAPPFDTGLCINGDGCDFRAQTGCAADQTCHPAGALGFDNNRATVCQPALTMGPGQGEPCAGSCRPGYRCVSISSRQAVCLKYCTPGDATHGCAGVPVLSPEIACGTGGHTPLLCPDGGADGGGDGGGEARCYDLLGDAPAPQRSIPAGICR